MALPSEFSDLERFSDGCLATEPERYAKRLASSMTEMQDLYDTCLSRLEEAIAYLAKFPLDELPDCARARVLLVQTRLLVSFPVEVWKQPRVPDSGAAYLNLVQEPVV